MYNVIYNEREKRVERIIIGVSKISTPHDIFVASYEKQIRDKFAGAENLDNAITLADLPSDKEVLQAKINAVSTIKDSKAAMSDMLYLLG